MKTWLLALVAALHLVAGTTVTPAFDYSVRFEKYSGRSCLNPNYYRPHSHWYHVWVPERYTQCEASCIASSDCAGFRFNTKTEDVGPHYQCTTCKFSVEGGTPSSSFYDLFHMRTPYSSVRSVSAPSSQSVTGTSLSKWDNGRAVYPGNPLTVIGSGLPSGASTENTRIRIRRPRASGPNLSAPFPVPAEPTVTYADLIASPDSVVAPTGFAATDFFTVLPTKDNTVSIFIPGTAVRPLTRYVITLNIRGDSFQDSHKDMGVWLGVGGNTFSEAWSGNAVFGQAKPVTGRQFAEFNAGWQALEFPLWSGDYVPNEDFLGIWVTGSWLTSSNISFARPTVRIAAPLNPTRLTETNFALSDSPSSAQDQTSVVVATNGANQPSKSAVVVVDLCDVPDTEVDSVVVSAEFLFNPASPGGSVVVIEAKRLDLASIGTGDGSAMTWADVTTQTSAHPSTTTTIDTAALKLPTANLELVHSFSSSDTFAVTPGPTTSIAGAVGDAIELDGTQSIVDDGAFLSGASQFTLAAFVKPAVALPGSPCQSILEWGEAGSPPQVSLSACAKSVAPAASVQFTLTTGGGDDVAGTGQKLDLAPEQWTHLALTVDLALGKARLYQDGVPWTQTNFTLVSAPATMLMLMSSKLTTGSGFEGGIDEVLVYSSALSDADVKRLARGALIKWDVTNAVPRNKNSCAKVAFALQAHTFAANDEVQLSNLRVDVLSSNDDPILQSAISSVTPSTTYPGRVDISTDALEVTDLQQYFDGTIRGWWALDVVSDGVVTTGEQSIVEILPHKIDADTREPLITSADGWHPTGAGDKLIEVGTRISITGTDLDGATVVIGNIGIRKTSQDESQDTEALLPQCSIPSFESSWCWRCNGVRIDTSPVDLPPGVTGPMMSTEFTTAGSIPACSANGVTQWQLSADCINPVRFKPSTFYQFSFWWRVTNDDGWAGTKNQFYVRANLPDSFLSSVKLPYQYGEPNVGWYHYNVFFKSSPTVNDNFQLFGGGFRCLEQDTLDVAGLSIREIPQAEAQTGIVATEIRTRADLLADTSPDNSIWGVGYSAHSSLHQATYLSFDLSLIPQNAFVLSAQLQASTSFQQEIGSDASPHAVGLFGVDGAPAKCGATAADCTVLASEAPVVQTQVGPVSTVDSDTQYVWDVTSYLNSVLSSSSGGPVSSLWLLLKSVSDEATESSTWFNGLELGSNYAPALQIYFSEVAPPALCDVDESSASANFVSCVVRGGFSARNSPNSTMDLSVFARGKLASPQFQVSMVGPTASGNGLEDFCAAQPKNLWCAFR